MINSFAGPKGIDTCGACNVNIVARNIEAAAND
jgi:hypothetical protein